MLLVDYHQLHLLMLSQIKTIIAIESDIRNAHTAILLPIVIKKILLKDTPKIFLVKIGSI